MLLHQPFRLRDFLLYVGHMPFSPGAYRGKSFAGTQPIPLHRAHLDQGVQPAYQLLEFLYLRRWWCPCWRVLRRTEVSHQGSVNPIRFAASELAGSLALNSSGVN